MPSPSPTQRRLLVIGVHLLLWAVGLHLALLLRFDGDVPLEFRAAALRVLPAVLGIRTLLFWRGRLFDGLLRYSGVAELRSVIQATLIGSGTLAVLGFMFPRLAVPRSIYFLEGLLALATSGGLRMGVRLLTDRSSNAIDRKPIILLGGGDAGELFLRDLHRSRDARLEVVGILDDDSSKRGLRIHGVAIEAPSTAQRSQP